MSQAPIPRGLLFLLLAGTLVLPMAVCVVLLLSALLGAMGDAAGAQVLVYIGWAIGAIWSISVIGLIVALAIQSLGLRDSSEDHLDEA